MIHPDLYYRVWTQQQDARIRDLEFRRTRKEASEARIAERSAASGQPRTATHRNGFSGFINVAIRLLQVGVSW
jgi:shikimate kinase